MTSPDNIVDFLAVKAFLIEKAAPKTLLAAHEALRPPPEKPPARRSPPPPPRPFPCDKMPDFTTENVETYGL